MAASRILKTKLREPIERALQGRTRASLAEAIGISRPKLNALLREEWNYITRDAIERVADYFQLDVAQVFEFIPVPFWEPFEQQRHCTFLRGSHEAVVIGTTRELTIPYFDSQSTGVIERFLREHVPAVSGTRFADHLHADIDIVERAKRENCIVIGSPQTNAATEILLSRFFGAEPFTPLTTNRRIIPFGFCWSEENSIARESSLTCSELAKQQMSGMPGIALRGGYKIDVDYRPEAEFKAWETRKGLDCGLIFVANSPFSTTDRVKLIVIAGLHGIGTLGAAFALIEDYRHLEPLEGEKCVIGIVQATYTKQKNSTERTYTGFAWRYREGGNAPILSS